MTNFPFQDLQDPNQADFGDDFGVTAVTAPGG